MSRAAANTEENAPRNMREIVQQKFRNEVIGAAAASGSGWLVLVMDEAATRIISSALTMYDIMEQRITLVEQLSRVRQPFKEMEVVYLISPTMETARLISDDFESDKKARYAAVHLFFLDTVGDDVMRVLQSNGNLCSRIKTFKEVNLHFISLESNVFHLDMPEMLSKFLGDSPDPRCPYKTASRLATLCVTLNEMPVIRFMGSSTFTRETATTLLQMLNDFKKSNSSFWSNGDDGHNDRERGQIIILDRSFDPLSPLMHEYTYQAMVNDLLPVKEGVLSYIAETNSGEKVEKQALLGENDDLWMELRHLHIAQVIEIIKSRMDDIIQNNAGAAFAKKNGGEMSITKMAQAVKALPEYRETMSKLSQHVSIAQQSMDVFTKVGLFDVSKLEQTMSTGIDEEGKEIKGQKLLALLTESLTARNVTKLMKVRLIAIYIITQGGKIGNDEKRQLIQCSGLSGPEQQVLLNFERLGMVLQETQAGQAKGGILSIFKGKSAAKQPTTAEGEYPDTRHICRIRSLLEQFLNNELPADKFPAVNQSGGSQSSSESKSVAKSVRRYGSNSRWGKKNEAQYVGGRYIVFVAGGVGLNELRAVSDLSTQSNKEIVVGGSHIISPNDFVRNVASLTASCADVFNESA